MTATNRSIESMVERSSLGTKHARRARQMVARTAAAKLVARAQAEQQRRDEKKSPNLGG